jgi:hypothetical protein
MSRKRKRRLSICRLRFRLVAFLRGDILCTSFAIGYNQGRISTGGALSCERETVLAHPD